MPPAGRPGVLRIRERAAASPRPSLSSCCADLGPCRQRRGRADGLAQVQVAAQPYAGLAGVPRRRLRCRRCPPVGEQRLEGERRWRRRRPRRRRRPGRGRCRRCQGLVLAVTVHRAPPTARAGGPVHNDQRATHAVRAVRTPPGQGPVDVEGLTCLTGNRHARPLSTEQGPDPASGPSPCPGIFPPSCCCPGPGFRPQGVKKPCPAGRDAST